MSDELIVLETLRPEVVFSPGGVEALLEKLERDVRAVATDISTKAGRAAISSLAHKVSRSKTALDDLGKGLVADWKLRSALVDAERRRIRERLDELRDEVRKPLTKWEDAEKARVEGHENEITFVDGMRLFTESEPTALAVSHRIAEFDKRTAAPREWHEFAKRASETTAKVKVSLEASYDTAVRRENERAELARLRAEAAERERQERDDRLRAEAAEKARAAAEAEARQAASLQAAREAAERARVDRERVAAEEARRAAEAAAEKATADAKAAAEKAERDRVAAEEKSKRDADAAVEAERRRVALEEEKVVQETARRQADEAHKEKIHGEIRMTLLKAGMSKANVVIAVHAIVTGEVPHVKVIY